LSWASSIGPAGATRASTHRSASSSIAPLPVARKAG
jgi:hypothetical protein